MDINQVGATSPEEYENARMAAKFAMTNEDLANAIDAAARHSASPFGPGKRENIMLEHLQKLLELQLRRAAIVKISGPDFKTPNVEVTGAARLYRAESSDRRERGRQPG